MATLTAIAARDVGRTLTARIDAVVALHAIGGDPSMIEWRSQPLGGGVARVTLGYGRHVIDSFAAGRDAVVTRRTHS